MIVNKNSPNSYLKLFSSIKLTRGNKQTLLSDFDRNKMRIIPNDLYDFIEKCKFNPFAEVFKEYDANDKIVISEYVCFLEDNEYIIFTREPNRFPEIDLTWKSPRHITNAVIDVEDKSTHDYKYIIKILDDLGCQALDVRIFNAIKYKNIIELLDASNDCRLKSLKILLPYCMIDNDYKKLFAEYPRLGAIIFHGSPKNEVDILGASQSLLFITNRVDSPSCCGHVSEKLMLCNLELFSESQKHNNCLNKKLSIDTNGIIKNCSAMQKSFGHYKDTDVRKLVLKNSEFTRLWKISKNDIVICKDCEFRYVCVDCRAMIENRDDILSKPAKCKYIPYTSRWE